MTPEEAIETCEMEWGEHSDVADCIRRLLRERDEEAEYRAGHPGMCCGQCIDEIKQAEARSLALAAALESYGEHDRDCIRQRFEAGEPTPDGGYRVKYAGVWYESKPVDRSPACTCGFDAALADPLAVLREHDLRIAERAVREGIRVGVASERGAKDGDEPTESIVRRVVEGEK